jgi:uncharacterized protein (UPF0276 family)
LLDINNIAVSAHNLGYYALSYIKDIKDDGRVKQFHLAGYQVNELEDGGKFISIPMASLFIRKSGSFMPMRCGDLAMCQLLIEWVRRYSGA